MGQIFRMVVTCLDVCIIYFVSCDCMMISSLSYTIYKTFLIYIAVKLIIKYICSIYTRLDTCLMSTSRCSFRDKATLRLLKLHLCGADMVDWSRALDIRLSDLFCSESMV